MVRHGTAEYAIIPVTESRNKIERTERTAMDDERFDRFARIFGGGASRRAALGGLVAAGATALGFGPTAAAKKKCPRAKRCGKGCCGPNRCFVKAINSTTGQITAYGCCAPDKLCKAKTGNPDQDECCYSDERCVGEASPGSGGSICCRRCGPTCCDSGQKCDTETLQCVQLGSARLPRRRR